MTGRPRRQLVLELSHEGALRLVAQRSPELVQALADLLLEALDGGATGEGAVRLAFTSGRERGADAGAARHAIGGH